MATRQINRVVEEIRKVVLASDSAEVSDGQLLECFIARREEAAFDSLLRRHGPMVLSVCQRVLGNHHDAEDAFQATFLVLARKASSIVPRQMVGNWLYGVAYQTALKARSVSAKRRVREKQMNPMPEAEAPAHDSWPDLQRVLDVELNRLSDKYRVPIVLCDLEGKSQKAAAGHLGLPEGTFSSRLSRGRAMLAKRLARQGLTFSAGALAVVLSQNGASACVSSVLALSTLKAAGAFAAGQPVAGLVSGSVASLTDGVLKAMLLNKLKMMAAVLVLLAIVGFGGGFLMQRTAVGQPGQVEKKEQPDTGRSQRVEEASKVPVFFALKKVDVEKRTIGVALFGTNQTVNNLPIAKNAKIQYDLATRSFSKKGPVWSIPPGEWRLSDFEPRLGTRDTPLTLTFAPDGKTVTGMMAHFGLTPGFLRGFDAQNMMIEVSPLGGPHGTTFPATEKLWLPNDVEVIIDGKKGKMTDLRPGMIVEVFGDADGVGAQDNVTIKTTPRLFISLKMYGPFAKIEAFSPLIDAIVESVEPEKKTLSVSLHNTKLVFENLPVADDVKVFIDGRQAKLDDLKKLTHVVMELRGDAPAPKERRIVTIKNTTTAKGGAAGKNDGVYRLASKSELSNGVKKPLTDPEDAIDFLKKKGVRLERDKSGLVVQALLPVRFSLQHEAITHLRQLPKLAWLVCNEDLVWSPDDFKQLATLPSLEEFELNTNKKCPPMPWKALGAVRCVRLAGDGVDDALLEAVSEMPAVTSLHLNGVAITPAGLAHLKGLRGLDMLLIQGSKVTAEGVRRLGECEKVTSLTLCGNDIGAEGFARLGTLTRLKYLNLESTRCTDNDVAVVTPLLTNLIDLDLGYNPGVTDAGLRHLAGLKTLAGLRLYETKVTDGGVAELKKALPRLIVGK